ncbi:MAG: class I adenylate-forming enzyme family protein [Pseudomonadota bacterium]
MILHSQDAIAHYTALGAWGGQTLHGLLAARCAEAPDTLALADPPNKGVWVDCPVRRLTWREVLDGTARIAFALHRAGLRRDDVILTQLPNISEFAMLHLACAQLGVVISPIHVQQRENEVLRCGEIAQARALVTLRRIGKSDQVAFAQSLRDRHGCMLPVMWLEDLLAAGDAALLDEVNGVLREAARSLPVTANDIYSICWTSGTEGSPKGVPRSHNNWQAVARRIINGAGLRPGDVLLNPFPLVAVAGMTVLVPWLIQGGRLVLHQPSDLPVMLGQIRDEGAHYVCIAPALLNRLLVDPGLVSAQDLRSLRVIGSGSGPIDAWTIREFKNRHGIEIVNFYGSNEGVGLTAGESRVPDPAKRAVLFPAAGRAGQAWGDDMAAHAITRLIDPATGNEVTQPGTPGELAVKGPTVFPGYYRAPEKNAASFTPDGFFLTGDMFSLEVDEDPARPYYRFMGRYKDIIIRGGMKISPEELDALLIGHPKLREAACCGWRDAIMGEKVGVVAVPAPGQQVTLDDITAWLKKAGVATYKLPEALACIDALPRNALNKVLRRDLRGLFDNVASTPGDEARQPVAA